MMMMMVIIKQVLKVAFFFILRDLSFQTIDYFNSKSEPISRRED